MLNHCDKLPWQDNHREQIPPTHILLVEDNPGDVFLVNALLNQVELPPYEVTQVDSLSAAFQCLETDYFDVALLDLGLPDSQGMETLLGLQAKAPGLPTVVLTGLEDEALSAQLVRQGAQDYLIKGQISQSWLKSAIAHAIARSKWLEEQYQKERQLQQSNWALRYRVRECKNELAHMNDQLHLLEARSSTDALTGIANRYGFEQYLEREWLQARRDQRPLSVIMVDIDYFKQFNDSCGHPWGDECLKQVAQSLKAALKRPLDLIARYGGEEFVAILPDTVQHGAVKLATKMGARVKALAIRHPDSAVSSWVTASFGVASVIPTQKASSVDLIEQADQALYRAKTAGRDRIAYFQPPNFVTQPID